MILRTDIPSRAEIDRLLDYRAPSSVSIYLRTDPVSNGDPERIELCGPLLNGLEVPLIVAATEPIDSISQSVNTYPHLLAQGLSGNPETVSDAELAASSRAVLAVNTARRPELCAQWARGGAARDPRAAVASE